MSEGVGWTLGCLACWRLTHLLWAEDGPWQVIARLRDRLPRSPHSGLPWLFGCFYCLSLWVALPITALVMASQADGLAAGSLGRTAASGLLGWLGLSGAAISLERWLDRPSPPAPPGAQPPQGDQP
jgi:hypothetical protein